MVIAGKTNKPHAPRTVWPIGRLPRLAALFLFALLLFAPNPPHASASTPAGVRHILLLASYHAGFAWDDGIKQAVTDVLNPVENNLELHFEYMDTKRIEDARYVAMLHDLYRHKYRAAQPSLIIASDNFAFDFLRSYRYELFPGVPVVFCGVNFYRDEMLKGQHLFTGAAEEVDAARTLDLILKLHPGTRELFVLNDHDISGNAWAGSIREQITGRHPDLKITYAGKLSEDEAIDAVRALPPTTAVLLGIFLRDRLGAYVSAPHFGRKLAAASRVPIYGLLDLYMGYGIVGGEIIDGYHQGEVAARIAQRVLNGEPADSIPVMKRGMTRTMFDYNQMHRFGISEADLPANSTLLNRPHSFYDEHRLAIWLVVIFVVAESVLVFFLVANRMARRKAEQALRGSQQQLQSVLDNSNALIYVKDMDGRYLLINRHFETTYNLRREETIGRTDADLFTAENAHAYRSNDRRVAESQTPLQVEETLFQEDGPHTYISVKFPLFGPDGTVHATGGISSDITGHMRMVEQLELKTFAMENITDAVYWVSADGRFWDVNQAACTHLGYTRDELLALSVPDVAPEIPPEAWQPHWQTLQQRRNLRFESVQRAKDGRLIPVEIHVTYCRYHDQEASCAIVRDITKRKEAEAERQLLTEQLSQARKIESIGRLAGGIAHDFNNLLTPIIGYAELLKGGMPVGRNVGMINSILLAADKARILTQQLLSFGRKQILEMRTVNVDEVITSFYEILRRTIREDIAIRLSLSKTSCSIRADRNQLEQIIMNLVINAQDAIAERGDITIETALEILDDEYARQHAEVTPGWYLMLVVSDSGSGMDEETLSRLFEPFFTTKVMGKGSGLGLATVYGLVKQHGGHIWVYSEVGKGTVFKVYFPVIDEKPLVAQEPATEGVALDSAGRTVLLAEDNAMVRKLVYDLLNSHGFAIIESEGPRQALELAEGKEIDLLITDVVMPDMSGPELHQRLLVSHPGLKVLYMSGYTENTIVHHGVLDEGIHFIQKPFAVNDMARKINEVLLGDSRG